MVIEKGDTFARLSAVRDKLLKVSFWKPCPQRTSARCIDAQAIPLLAIRRCEVALEEFDIDAVTP